MCQQKRFHEFGGKKHLKHSRKKTTVIYCGQSATVRLKQNKISIQAILEFFK